VSYAVKEIFTTLQGEGARAGRVSVFCRFSGCNLWSGREEDRTNAVCRFCDTDFVGVGADGGRFETAELLADRILVAWPGGSGAYVVLTGGEPTLQVDAPLLDALHARGFEIAMETNGSRPVPPGVDWLTVSPKAGAPLIAVRGDELKLVFPQPGLDPDAFLDLDFGLFLLQPMDGPDRDGATAAAVRHCLSRPRWRLSVQTHKYLGLR